jgi:hypothetical protein
MDFSQSEPILNPEPAFSVEPVAHEPLSPPPAPQKREPFWDYVDLLMVIGIGFAFVVVFCFPLVLFFRSETGVDRHLVAIAATLQAGLYLAVYLSIKAVFTLRHGVKSVFGSLGWRSTRFNLAAAAVGGVALAFVVSGIASLLHTPQVDSPIEQFTKSTGAIVFISVLAITAAPVFEELFFRGLLQPLLSRTFGSAAGIVLTGMLFGFLHLSEYAMVWQYGLAITLVGVALGYVRARSGSLIPSTVMHGCFNSVSVIALVLSKYVKH